MDDRTIDTFTPLQLTFNLMVLLVFAIVQTKLAYPVDRGNYHYGTVSATEVQNDRHQRHLDGF